jgi:HMG (high mobility group) box
MMNKDDASNDSTAEGRKISLEVMDTSDDRKPPAKVNTSTGKLPPFARPPVDPNQPLAVKRKRKSPEKPWKKPADMPKRPLSAYNIFFRDERERLLGAGSDGNQPDAGADIGTDGKGAEGKKGKKRSGIGFANLAKTIAARWNELGNEIRAPYEKIAATEKKKYDELVAEWRIKQATKKKAQALVKKDTGDERKSSSNRGRGAPNLFPSDRSLGSFSDSSNPYPSEWFHSAPEHDASEREDSSSSRTSVPPIVDTSSAPSYDKRMYDHAMSNQSWQYGRQDPASYYHHSPNVYDEQDSQMRYSPDSDRATYLNQHMFSHHSSMRGSSTHDAPSGYRDYYHHSQQPMYHQHSAGRHNDMRMSRAASLPASRHETSLMTQYPMRRTSEPPLEELAHHLDVHHQIDSSVAQLRASRESLSRHHRYQYSSSTDRGVPAHPRASSLPFVQYASSSSGSRRRRVHGPAVSELMPPPPNVDEMNDGYRLPEEYGGPHMDVSTGSRRHLHAAPTNINPGTMEASLSTTNAALAASVAPTPRQAIQPPPTHNESVIMETSLHSLNETLDEDAISFITSMKYS